jgi:hypothetical protein
VNRRIGAFVVLALLLGRFGPSLALGQSAPPPRAAAQTATVVLAVDLRELTSLRDVSHVGDVLIRRIDRRQGRGPDDYDLAIRGSVAADWKSFLGGADDNRAPHVFTVAPGTYVIEKINIGAGPTTAGPGVDPQGQTPRFGSFVVRDGEVVNLGRLVVHMHWHEGYFAAKVEDNTAEARTALATGHPGLAARLQTRLIKIVPRFPYQMGGGR